MKKILGIVVLGLMLGSNTYAKIIYCYEANQGNKLLKSRIASDFINSEIVEYFEIDDNKKKLIPIKNYWEYKKKIEYDFQNNDIYKFVYYSPEYISLFKAADTIKFNKNEIKISVNFKTKDGSPRREIYELDRVAGILIVANYGVNSAGEIITTDDDGMIYTQDDEKFLDYIKDDKFFCENHKGL